ncbi:MAG: hypothetical protein ABI697_11715 [Devosia sp.]
MMTPALTIQPYPARATPLRDVLQVVAALGYDSLQPYTPLILDRNLELTGLLQEFKLAVHSVMFELSDLETDFRTLTDTAKAMGSDIITVPHISPGEVVTTAEDWERLAERMASISVKLRGEGIRLSWANHDIEYYPFADGRRPIDIMLAHDEIDYELVVGWLASIGKDTTAEVEKYGDRIRVLRIRDWDSAKRQWTSLGAGDVGLSSLEVSKRTMPNLVQIVVDHDLTDDFPEFARLSLPLAKRIAHDWAKS